MFDPDSRQGELIKVYNSVKSEPNVVEAMLSRMNAIASTNDSGTLARNPDADIDVGYTDINAAKANEPSIDDDEDEDEEDDIPRRKKKKKAEVDWSEDDSSMMGMLKGLASSGGEGSKEAKQHLADIDGVVKYLKGQSSKFGKAKDGGSELWNGFKSFMNFDEDEEAIEQIATEVMDGSDISRLAQELAAKARRGLEETGPIKYSGHIGDGAYDDEDEGPDISDELDNYDD